MFAVLAFYTRLNHLPLIVVLVAFALPEDVTAESIFRWRRLRDRFPVRVGVVYLGCVALGVCAFMARTWYYTGEFSLFAGTTRAYNGTGLSLSSTSLLSPTTWRIALGSVLMIATVQDPPRFDARSLLVIGGVCGSLLALLQVPVLRRLPLNLALACVGAVAGGLVARGVAYPGRFSVHVIPLAVTASVLAIVAFTRSQGITVGPEA